MVEVFCEACSEVCGRGCDGESGRCRLCGAHGEVSYDEDGGFAYAKFVLSKRCTCHIDEDDCDAHVEWVLTPMAEMLAELQIQVAQEFERQRGWAETWSFPHSRCDGFEWGAGEC